MKRWEYDLGQDFRPWETLQWLNDMGKEGWECYHVQPYTIHDTDYVYLFMKREVQ